MSTDIPQARDLLKQIATDLRSGDVSKEDAAIAVEWIVDALMIRSFTGRKTPTKHRKMTDEIAVYVRRCAEAHPTLSHEEIARRFDINAGRVSEVLSGKRFVEGRAVDDNQPTRNPT